MNHAPWEQMASAWLDGELTGAEREAFASHLETCPACRAQIEQSEELGGVIRAGLAAACPTDLESRMLASRRTASGAGRGGLHRIEFKIPLPLAAAAAVLLIALGALGGRMFGPGTIGGLSTVSSSMAEDTTVLPASQEAAVVLLERARSILLALSTAHPDDEGNFHLTAEQTASAGLMQDVRLVASGAEVDENEELQTLIHDLEAILLDVSTWQGSADPAQVAVLQGGIRDRSLIYRLNTYTDRSGTQ